MVEVRKKENETASAMLRRFTRRIQMSRVLLEARKRRFHSSKPTKRNVRLQALRRTTMKGEYQRLEKLGKNLKEKK